VPAIAGAGLLFSLGTRQHVNVVSRAPAPSTGCTLGTLSQGSREALWVKGGVQPCQLTQRHIVRGRHISPWRSSHRKPVVMETASGM